MMLCTLRPSPRQRRRAAGFSLVELLVTMALVVVLLVIVLGVVDLYNKLARVQLHVADMQQSVRVGQDEMVRFVRMAARGALQRGPLPGGIALAVRNNVPANEHIAIGNVAAPLVLEGTDILTVRGVMEGSLYQLLGSSLLLDDPAAPVAGTGGTVEIKRASPKGIAQLLEPLIDAVNEGRAEPLLLVSGTGESTVVILDPTDADTNVSNADDIVLAFDITAQSLALSGGVFPPGVRFPAAVGVIEEYRFYVREVRADPSDPTSELMPRLSRARFVPATELPFNGDIANLAVDISDNILDLQVALAVDIDGPAASGPDGLILENGSATDDWLFNVAADDSPFVPARWNPVGATPRLFYVRINTLARTDRRDWKYVSPAIAAIEDRVYNEPANPTAPADLAERMFRRRLLQTVIDLRNIS